jgi:hypothetical protein
MKTEFEYASNWQNTRRKTLKLMPRCTCNPLHKASIVHHLKYKRSLLRRLFGCFLLHNPFQASVSGYEILGWDIVPVCSSCHENSYGRSLNHKSVHYTKVWKQKGGLNNHNTFFFTWKMRFLFWIWISLLMPLRCCHQLMKSLKKEKKAR